jgi:hypothetical protein
MALALAQADTPSDLEALREVYQTSCGNRGYAQFDDVCNTLQAQVHAAEVAADRAAHEAKRKADQEARARKRDLSKAAQGATPPAPPPTPRLGETPPPKG